MNRKKGFTLISLVVIIAVIVISIVAYFAYKNKNLDKTMTDVSTYTPELIPATDNDETNLKIYVKSRYDRQNSMDGNPNTDVAITVNKNENGFASGTAKTDGKNESFWFAAKVNESWIMVEQTDTKPTCQLMSQYKFPKTIYEECV